MKATISLDGILSLIHAFSLDADSKRWLAEKLIEEVKEEKRRRLILANIPSRNWNIVSRNRYKVTKAERIVRARNYVNGIHKRNPRIT